MLTRRGVFVSQEYALTRNEISEMVTRRKNLANDLSLVTGSDAKKYWMRWIDMRVFALIANRPVVLIQELSDVFKCIVFSHIL